MGSVVNCIYPFRCGKTDLEEKNGRLAQCWSKLMSSNLAMWTDKRPLLMNDECDIAMLVSVNDIFPASLAPNTYRMLARVQGFF